MHKRSPGRLLTVVSPFVLILAGCVHQPVSPVIVVPPEPDPKVLKAERLERDIQQLLNAAERALAADRLTKPAHDNAYDRFQAVLLLRPNHPQAISGLQQVMLRYLALARQSAARSELGKARALLERARQVDKDSVQIAELDRQLAAQQARQQSDSKTVSAQSNEYVLPASELDKRGEKIVTQLQQIAQQARGSGEFLLIVARGDAEGRWIYQQMKEAVPGFRLRGDIQLGRKAKVLLLPPID